MIPELRLQSKQNDLDLVPRPLPVANLVKEIWWIGLVTYGGPLAHIGLFKRKFVDQLQWLDADMFVELTTICQSVPGPTSTQLLVAVAMMVTQSIKGGLVAFAMFCLPSFFVLMASGYLLRSVDTRGLIDHALKGFLCMAVAVVAQAFWGLSKRFRQRWDSILVIVLCASVYLMWTDVKCMALLFVGSSIYAVHHNKDSQTILRKETSEFLGHPLMGKTSFLLLLGLLGIAFVVPLVIDTRITNQLSIFFKMGSIIIGGGHVILPIMWNQLESYNYFTESEFWTGFSLVSCLPGPMFNLTSYIGVLINGFLGSIVCTLSLNLPALLSLMAVMPYWEMYRCNQKIQKVIYGLCCASIGLILAAVAILWKTSCYSAKSGVESIVNTGISLLGLYLLEGRGWGIPQTMLIGAVVFMIKP